MNDESFMTATDIDYIHAASNLFSSGQMLADAVLKYVGNTDNAGEMLNSIETVLREALLLANEKSDPINFARFDNISFYHKMFFCLYFKSLKRPDVWAAALPKAHIEHHIEVASKAKTLIAESISLSKRKNIVSWELRNRARGRR